MRPIRVIGWMLFLVAVAAAGQGNGRCETPAAAPRKGAALPRLTLNAPASNADCDYLGIEAGKPFRLADVNADLIMVEILGVYCPQCHKQRPHINRLYHRIQKNAPLAEKIKFVGIAVGASPMEAAYLVKDTHIPYPIITDESFDIHKQLGEPRTPFNLVTTRDGVVVWVHLGIIEDMNVFYATLKKLADL